ncbi:MAG TPA: hypothetical protein VJN18_19835 [Polyangiaceae bacterium]|nr:hypothetical protein [Polyangiaceae bacterium]
MTLTALSLCLAGSVTTSCVLKDDPNTDLGHDQGSANGDNGQPSSSIIPPANGDAAQAGAGASDGPSAPNTSAGGAASSSDDGQPMGNGDPVAGGGAPGGLTSAVNQYGFAFEDSFFLASCKSKFLHHCLTNVPCPPGGETFEEEFQLGGELGKTYDVTIQVNGIVEGRAYIGGQRRTESVPDDVETAVNDAFYVGGQPASPSNYQVYRLSVLQPDGQTERQHYFLNSFGLLQENHRLFLIGYEATITVPGQGVIRYTSQNRECHSIANCNAGEVLGSNCPSPRLVPNEPTLQLPASYAGQPLSSLNQVSDSTSQPWPTQLVHITVTNVVENP